MPDPIAIAQAAMLNDVRRLEIISQNLANANTSGFKRDIPVNHSFDAVLAGAVMNMGLGTHGNGAAAGQITALPDMTHGVFKNTGNKLDVAIQGKGFFEITTPGGVGYTRAGSFTLDSLGRMTTAEGWPVNTMSGELRLHGTDPLIDREGRIWEGDLQVGQLRIVEFGEATRFEKMGGKLLSPIGNVEITESSMPSVRQGYLEASNVDSMQEMVRMMETVRHFESAQRVITGYDEMLGTAIDTIAEF